MQELISLVLGYLRGVWRYRWYVLVVGWVVCLVGWVWVARMPDQFEAFARVFVNTDSVLKPLLRGLAAQTDDQRRIFLMEKTLLSRPNLEKITRMVDLDLRAETKGDMDLIVKELKDNIQLRGTREVNLYTIAYTDPEPELAKNIVQSLLTIFVEGSLGDKRKDTDAAERFLVSEVEHYEQRLRDAEESMKEFKKANMGLMPGQGGDYYEQLETAQAALEKAQLDVTVAIKRRDELRRQMESTDEEFEDSMSLFGGDAPMSELGMRIQNLQQNMDELLLRYTEKHPDVVEIKRTIARLEKRQAEEYAYADASDAVNPEVVRNPVRQSLQMALGEAAADVAAKRAVVENSVRAMEKMKQFVDHRLRVETQLKDLNRDYSLIMNNYQQMLTKLESLRLTEKIETRADTVSFRVIDPPRVPALPSGPNRVLFSSMVLGGGLLAGLAFAFLLSQIRPTFDDRGMLNEATGIPVLGSINMVWTVAQKRRRAITHLTFIAGLLGLLVCYGVVVSAFLMEVNLTSLLEQI